jgi:hypothetical protein
MTAQWRTAPINGVWRLEHEDFCGHELTVYRSKAPGAYRAYLDGHMLGLRRRKKRPLRNKQRFAHNSRPAAPSRG